MQLSIGDDKHSSFNRPKRFRQSAGWQFAADLMNRSVQKASSRYRCSSIKIKLIRQKQAAEPLKSIKPVKRFGRNKQLFSSPWMGMGAIT